MKTVVYLSSNKALDKFDWMQEEFVLYKQVKDRISDEDFINIVKTDLRNGIDCLLIDVAVFEQERMEAYGQGIETFQMLNSECPVILYAAEEDNVSLKDLDLPVISSQSAIEEQFLNLFNGQEQLIQEADFQKIVEVDNTKNIEIDIGKSLLIPEEKEPEKTEKKYNEDVVSVAINDICERANQKVKTNEGVPLAKRCLEEKKTVSKSYLKAKDNLTRLKEVWTCKNVVIAVVGSQRRTGTTTEAMRLCTYLDKHGAKVCYSEAVMEGHKHLASIAEQEALEIIEEGYRKENIIYYPDSVYDIEAGFNFIVIDLGSIEERPKWIISVLKNLASEVILVSSGTRLYEEESLKAGLELLSNIEINVNVIINFICDGNMNSLKDKYESCNVLVHRGEYESALFTSTRTEEEIAALLQRQNE